MAGSYIVNESVKTGSRPRYNSYRRCLCLIATIFVFTVATVVVLLALQGGHSNASPTVKPTTENLHFDRLKDAQRPAIKRMMPLRSSTKVPVTHNPQLFITKNNDDEESANNPKENNYDVHIFPRNPTIEVISHPSSKSATTTSTTQLPTTSISGEYRLFRKQFVKYQQRNPYSARIEEEVSEENQQNPFYSPSKENEKLQMKNTEAVSFTTAVVDTTTPQPIKEPLFVSKRISPLGQLFPTSTTEAEPTTTSRLPPVTTQKTRIIPTQLPLPPTHCPKPCETTDCGKSVADLLMKVDFDMDPCDDFYKFSCNGLTINQITTTTTEERFRLQIQKYLKRDPRPEPFLMKYKSFYNSCIDFKCDGLTDPVVKFFRPYMTPLNLTGVVDEKRHKLTSLIGRILLDGRLSSRVIPLFDIQLEFQSDREAIPVITMPTIPPVIQTAHSEDLYVANCKKDAEEFSKTDKSAAKIYDHYENCLKNYTMYIKVLEKSMRIFEIFTQGSTFDQEQDLMKTLTTIEWDVLDVVGRLSDVEIITEMDAKGDVMTVNELSSVCPEIDWEMLFPVLYDGEVEKVKVRFSKRLKSICQFYKSHDYDLLRNVILSMLAHDWYVEFMRPTVISDRVAYCERLSNHLMQDVVSNVFMSQVPITELRDFETHAEKLLDQLKQTLIADVEGVHWLNADQKGDVILEIDRVNIVGNYPELLGKESNVMSNMVLYMSETDFVANVLVLQRRTRTIYRNFKDLSNATIFSNLFNPLSTEVQFIEGKNTIFVPLPLVNQFANGKVHLGTQQKYEIYSKLGFLISRTLLPRFAPKKLRSMIKIEDNELFSFYEEFGLAEPPILGHKSIGLELDKGAMVSSTAGRFADDASVRLALVTYDRFSLFNNDRPLFTLKDAIPMTYYLSVAQQFCSASNEGVHQMAIDSYTKNNLPNHLRVNNMMMNSAAFAKTFDCALGSTMNSPIKSQQFPFIDSSS